MLQSVKCALDKTRRPKPMCVHCGVGESRLVTVCSTDTVIARNKTERKKWTSISLHTLWFHDCMSPRKWNDGSFIFVCWIELAFLGYLLIVQIKLLDFFFFTSSWWLATLLVPLKYELDLENLNADLVVLFACWSENPVVLRINWPLLARQN